MKQDGVNLAEVFNYQQVAADLAVDPLAVRRFYRFKSPLLRQLSRQPDERLVPDSTGTQAGLQMLV